MGLYSGKSVHLRVLPADADTGRHFVRTDLQGPAQLIAASARAVCATQRCTTLGNDSGASLAMVEHMLAALNAFGVDNAILEVDGAEMPGMDGCASIFCDKIIDAGLQRQQAPRRYIEILRPLGLEADDSRVLLEPGEEPGLHISAFIDYPDTLIGAQSHDFTLTAHTFADQIAPARTFAMKTEVAAMQQAYLDSGGDLDDCLIVDGMVLEPGQTLRFDNEFARHKVLDIIGDIALAGAPIVGRYRSHKGGHALNTALVNALLDDPDAWHWRTFA